MQMKTIKSISVTDPAHLSTDIQISQVQVKQSTLPQNHTMPWVGRGFTDHPAPTPQLRTGLPHTRPDCPVPTKPLPSEHLQGWSIHTFSRQPVPVPHHLLSEEFPPGIQSKSPSDPAAGTGVFCYLAPTLAGSRVPLFFSFFLILFGNKRKQHPVIKHEESVIITATFYLPQWTLLLCEDYKHKASRNVKRECHN